MARHHFPTCPTLLVLHTYLSGLQGDQDSMESAPSPTFPRICYPSFFANWTCWTGLLRLIHGCKLTSKRYQAIPNNVASCIASLPISSEGQPANISLDHTFSQSLDSPYRTCKCWPKPTRKFQRSPPLPHAAKALRFIHFRRSQQPNMELSIVFRLNNVTSQSGRSLYVQTTYIQYNPSYPLNPSNHSPTPKRQCPPHDLSFLNRAYPRHRRCHDTIEAWYYPTHPSTQLSYTSSRAFQVIHTHLPFSE